MVWIVELQEVVFVKEGNGKSHDFEWVLRETINSFIFRTALLSVRAF
jgi:hypothetical protein